MIYLFEKSNSLKAEETITTEISSLISKVLWHIHSVNFFNKFTIGQNPNNAQLRNNWFIYRTLNAKKGNFNLELGLI